MTLTKEEYEAKRQARYDRLLAAAERAEQEANANTTQARQMANIIPFGQPILVGHYSEGRDRRYRERIENKYRKGYELAQKAASLRSRAEAVQNNNTVFSDDPAATEKLEAKIERLEKRQETMKAANKLIRKDDRAGLLGIGFSEERIERLLKPDWCGRIGFPAYEITNTGANIRRLKERVQVLAARSEMENSEKEINGIRIVENVDENRVQIFFPSKPSETVRSQLKQSGFRWTPTLGCWQAYYNANAKYYAQKIAKEIIK
jgi:DNA repair exonuclease SbcCD ATPase subunit